MKMCCMCNNMTSGSLERTMYVDERVAACLDMLQGTNIKELESCHKKQGLPLLSSNGELHV